MRSVVVTGSGKGIGRAIAARLSSDGWKVVGVERSEGSRTRELGICAEVVLGDAQEPDSHRRAAAEAERLAPLSAWVNNAGITRTTPLHKLDEATVREVLAINGLGYIWGCSTAVTRFTEAARPGSIVNIGSIHGRASHKDHGAYEFTKAGIDALTRSVAVTYGALGIRANAVAPGGVMTPHLRSEIDNAPDPIERERGLVEGPPMRRIAEVDEVAAIVAFLLSPEADYINGQSIAADGGWSASFGDPQPDRDLLERYGLT